jgi:hypothetical protein
MSKLFLGFVSKLAMLVWLHDIPHNATQHNDIQNNVTQHKGLICNTQHNKNAIMQWQIT